MLTNTNTNFYHKVNHKNNLTTLVGMMGTGKSKFGRLVSKTLNFNLLSGTEISRNIAERQKV